MTFVLVTFPNDKLACFNIYDHLCVLFDIMSNVQNRGMNVYMFEGVCFVSDAPLLKYSMLSVNNECLMLRANIVS